MEELIREYLVDEALIVIPVLLIFGKIFKETPGFKDWLIPYAIGILGVVITVLLIGLTPEAVVQGLLVSGFSVYGNQVFKQTIEQEEI